MDELDFLKKHWQQNKDFPTINKEEIRRMLYKKSSSIVKWIFIISIIELFLGITLNVSYYFWNTEKDESPLFLQLISEGFDVLCYIIITYFVFTFFNAYKRIRTTSNTKDLLTDILHTRKTVNHYIKFNIYVLFISMIIGLIAVYFDRPLEGRSTGEIMLIIGITSVIMALVCWLLLVLVRLYYRLIYVRLVRRLEKNYEELKKLED